MSSPCRGKVDLVSNQRRSKEDDTMKSNCVLNSTVGGGRIQYESVLTTLTKSERKTNKCSYSEIF